MRVELSFLLFYLCVCESISIEKANKEKETTSLLIRGDDTPALIDILLDIQSMMRSKNYSRHDKICDDKLNSVVERNDNLKEQFDILTINTQQKMTIMIENVSALRLLLVEQGEKIKMLTERMENIEDGAVINREKSSNVDLTHPIPADDVLQYSDSVAVNSYLISDILSVSPNSPQTIHLTSGIPQKKSEIKVTKADDTMGSLSKIVNRLRSEVSLLNLDSGNQAQQIAELQKSVESSSKGKKPLQSLCACPNETFENILQSINTEFAKVQESKDGVAKNRNEIEELKQQMGRLRVQHELLNGSMAIYEQNLQKLTLLRVNNSSSSSDVTNIMNQIDEVNKTLNGVMKVVETGRLPSEDILIKRNDLCVYPYVRRADSCYHVIDKQRLSWKEAREACKQLQGDLAAPKNFTSFRNYLLDLRLSRSYTFWVGGSDEGHEAKWLWVDGREVSMSEDVWESGQPNQGKSNNCMEIQPNVKYVASDQRCEGKRHFICQQFGS